MGLLGDLFTFRSTKAFDEKLVASLRPAEEIQRIIASYDEQVPSLSLSPLSLPFFK